MANEPPPGHPSLPGKDTPGWRFPQELVGRLEILPLESAWADPLLAFEAHRLALRKFREGDYFHAHEDWESLWKLQPLESPGRHAFQALIRLCAAGVKRKQNHLNGFFHHVRGALSHLDALEASAHPSTLSPNSWAELANWLRSHSQPAPNLEK